MLRNCFKTKEQRIIKNDFDVTVISSPLNHQANQPSYHKFHPYKSILYKGKQLLYNPSPSAKIQKIKRQSKRTQKNKNHPIKFQYFCKLITK